MHVLVAPDKFRGTLTAEQAADAVARGWGRARPADDVVSLPMADGGEGSLEALMGPSGRRVAVTVAGPLGDPLRAEIGIDGDLGVVEMAQASGLSLITPRRRDPLRSSTRGTGELMAAAMDEGARRLIVCLGGSATVDGGVGMATALGIGFRDERGRPIRDGGAALVDLARIDLSAADRRLATTDVVGAADVDSPLIGPTGASAAFGPQKGASPDDVVLLDRALAHLAAVVLRDLGVDLRLEPGAGAAGGLGFGLMAFCGAGIRPGVEIVMEATGFRGRLARSDLVITGEGSLDLGSLRGKVVAGVVREAERAGRPVLVLAGSASLAPPGVRVLTLQDRFGAERAVGDARRALEELAAEAAAEWAA